MPLLPIVDRVRQPDSVGLPTRQVRDQKDVNCCFSCALAAAMEAGDASMPALAPLFHFVFAGGQSAVIEGLTPAQARSALLQKGMCALERHPFEISKPNVARQPDAQAVEDGRKRRPIDRSSGTLLWKPAPTNWKRYLGNGFPIVIGIQPNADYMGLNAQRPMLKTIAGVDMRAGHAVAVIGYRDLDSCYVVQDSRGPLFGLQGQWFLPYSLATSPFVVLAFVLAAESI